MRDFDLRENSHGPAGPERLFWRFWVVARDLPYYPGDRKIENGAGRDGHPSLRPEHSRVVARLLHLFARTWSETLGRRFAVGKTLGGDQINEL